MKHGREERDHHGANDEARDRESEDRDALAHVVLPTTGVQRTDHAKSQCQ